MRNVHRRIVDAPADLVGPLLDRLGSDTDPLWPTPAWPPMVLDGPLAVGAAAGHATFRYTVEAYEAGRRVRFAFTPPTPFSGWHELSVEPLDHARCVLMHELEGSPTVSSWPVTAGVTRWLHDAVIEDLLDNAERAVGSVTVPSEWSPWVRLLRRLLVARPRGVPIPARARLARSAFDSTDLADAWSLRLAPGMPTDPRRWARAVFDDPPGWVQAALRARNALVGLVGIERGDASAFAPVAAAGSEVLVGADDDHLDFRASVLVDEATVTVTTVAATHDLRGRLYLAAVRPIHPRVVRALLGRAGRRLAEQAPPAGTRRAVRAVRPLRTG